MIPPYNGIETYAWQYGMVDYKNKTVLDIGAANGDTAEFFLLRGAKNIIAVEGLDSRFLSLQQNVKACSRILPLHMWLSMKEQYEDLIQVYRPEIVKVDVEGAEITLFDIDNKIWRIIPEFIIEVHSDDLLSRMLTKCKVNSYEVLHCDTWTRDVSLVYAKANFTFLLV